MPKPKVIIEVTAGRGQSWWTALSREQKRALVFPRLKAQESNASIGAAFGVTPNSIASLRDKWNHRFNKQNPFELKLLRASKGGRKSVSPPATEAQPEVKKKIPQSEGPMPKVRTEKQAPVAPEPEPAQTVRLPPKPAPVSTPAHRIVSRNVSDEPEAKRKLAVSEKTQCDYLDPDDGRQCGFVATVRTSTGKYCSSHVKNL